MSESRPREAGVVSRRRFLQAVGSAGAGGPLILHAPNKSGSRLPVVGSGEQPRGGTISA